MELQLEDEYEEKQAMTKEKRELERKMQQMAEMKPTRDRGTPPPPPPSSSRSLLTFPRLPRVEHGPCMSSGGLQARVEEFSIYRLLFFALQLFLRISSGKQF